MIRKGKVTTWKSTSRRATDCLFSCARTTSHLHRIRFLLNWLGELSEVSHAWRSIPAQNECKHTEWAYVFDEFFAHLRSRSVRSKTLYSMWFRAPSNASSPSPFIPWWLWVVECSCQGRGGRIGSDVSFTHLLKTMVSWHCRLLVVDAWSPSSEFSISCCTPSSDSMFRQNDAHEWISVHQSWLFPDQS